MSGTELQRIEVLVEVVYKRRTEASAAAILGISTKQTRMMAEGLWRSRKQRRSFHQPRLRREAFGELIQIDGRDHRWFEDRGDACTLLVFIDDATSRLVNLQFALSENTDACLSAVHAYVRAYGCPVAFYSDKPIAGKCQAKSPGTHIIYQLRIKIRAVALPLLPNLFC